jgi:hypothetical protein
VKSRLGLSRRSFGAFALAALPGRATAAPASSLQLAHFSRDVARCLEAQVVGIDLADVKTVFDGITAPVLGVGLGSGAQRGKQAVAAALEGFDRVGPFSLTIVYVPFRTWRQTDFRDVCRAVCAVADSTGLTIFGVLHDEHLASDSMQVAILTG